MNPLKSAAVIVGAVKVLVGSVAGVLLASDLLSPEVKAVVGLVVGVLLAVAGAADIVVRQLQGDDPDRPEEPLRWGGGGPAAGALVAVLGAGLLASGCGPLLTTDERDLGAGIVAVACPAAAQACDAAGDLTAVASPEDAPAARAWCARISQWCGLGSAVTVAVLDALTGPRLTASPAACPAGPSLARGDVASACRAGLAPAEVCAALAGGDLAGIVLE